MSGVFLTRDKETGGMRLKEPKQKGMFKREMRRNWVLYAMCLPALALLFLLSYLPLPGIYMAFTRFNSVDGIFGSPFVGLNNFSMFFTSPSAISAVTNTLIINFFGLILGLVVPIALAVCLNEIRVRIYKRLAQGVMFFPYFLSWVVIGSIIYGLLATDFGLVNNAIESAGGEPVSWYAQPAYWKPILIFANVWKWSGYTTIVYLAAITNFDSGVFEAATVDGASRFQQIIHLTVPMLKPVAVVLTLLSIGRIFYGDFGMVWGIVRNNPLLRDATTIIDTYVYGSMRTFGFSYATAVGLIQGLMGLILVTSANKLAKKINDGEGLF